MKMEMDYLVEKATKADLDFIYWMFDEAILFHKRNNYPVWKGYDKATLQGDLKNGHLHKIIIDKKIAMIFSAIYSDPYVWRDRDRNDAVYLHRIVVNPEFRGMKLFTSVFNWAINDAKGKSKKFLRLDTWGDNPKMIAYYESFGFRFVENYSTHDNHDLPIQHRNLFMALLEYQL